MIANIFSTKNAHESVEIHKRSRADLCGIDCFSNENGGGLEEEMILFPNNSIIQCKAQKKECQSGNV